MLCSNLYVVLVFSRTKMVKSLSGLKEDFSRMFVRQEADVIFTPRTGSGDCGTTAETIKGHASATKGTDSAVGCGDGSVDVGAHLAVLR